MARPVFLALPPVFQADAVVAACDVAVGDAHVAGVVDVDAVAVTYLEVVEQVDAVYHHAVATHEVQCPVCTILDGDVAHGDVAHVGEGEHMGSRVEGGDGFEFVGVAQLFPHEGYAVAVDDSLACDEDVLRSVGIEPKHAFPLVGSKGAEMIDALVGVGLDDRCGGEEEHNVGLQFHRSAEVGVAGTESDDAAALLRALVDGLLYGSCIVGLSIAFRSQLDGVDKQLSRHVQGDEYHECNGENPSHCIMVRFKVWGQRFPFRRLSSGCHQGVVRLFSSVFRLYWANISISFRKTHFFSIYFQESVNNTEKQEKESEKSNTPGLYLEWKRMC